MQIEYSGLNKLVYIVLFIAVFLLFIAGPIQEELSLPDEPRVAEIAREMWQSGDYVVPRLNEKPFLEKPPLYYWSVASVFSIAGRANAALSRIPSFLFGTGIILFTYALGILLFDRKTGIASAMIALTTHQFLAAEYKCLIDTSVSFFIIASFYFFMRGYLNRGGKTFNYLLMYAMWALAFLSKGPISLVIICPVILMFLFSEKNLHELKEMKIAVGALLFFLIATPWFYLLWQKGGSSYFYFYFVENHWNRFFSASLGHKQSFFYYFPKIFEILFPWSICLPFVIFNTVKSLNDKNYEHRQSLFLISIFAFIPFFILSIPSTKRSLYLLPVVPAFSLLTAEWMMGNYLLLKPGKFLNLFEKIFTTAFVIIASVMTIRWIWISGFQTKVSLISFILIISIISALFFSLSSDYKNLFISLFLISAVLLASYFNLKYETSWVKKTYYNVARSIKSNVKDDSTLRGYDLSENDMSIPFYLGKTFIEDKSWNTVTSNLRNKEDVLYLVNDDTLEDIFSILPHGVHITSLGNVDRSSYFLISNH